MEFITYSGNPIKNRELAEEFFSKGYSYGQCRDNVYWNRRRDEIFRLHGDQCRRCGHKETHLQVHHTGYRYYNDGLSAVPWDYHNDTLVTLCRGCHKNEEEIVKPVKENVLNEIVESGFQESHFQLLTNAGRRIPENYNIKEIVGAAWVALSDDKTFLRLLSEHSEHVPKNIKLFSYSQKSFKKFLELRGASSKDFALLVSALRKKRDNHDISDIVSVIWAAFTSIKEFKFLIKQYHHAREQNQLV